ncbi:Cyclic pyranopterin monophosphate synthase accessory protein [Jeotgalicoccus aerolatus]|uniref:Cyclic pyranopterin monophosphate synthase n=1 Tax=Jeotgalicoccus aerolatus TaxID=709510 RepID=A0A1G9CGG4_9STAP|nr:cyclic pyranopterin monophosphate synthase MoaC [Jeotgalicoccus aerolatus]MBP1951051.1 cyclic pyranopterin phosphate synthase [Jeotgalicoccus aerolatus]GGE00625.1 cyclic pyranopterin monophosphate synthase accessory protein [Jeotgalicoccus aerolatus]CAD2078342.1 Cyclic pyranopterin monophosphate synthase accessory protein [Jeotgalicoccus aerolatus]SDK50574.1 cyclic pyranopterin phosphate synthase [Jeotgalicoccus aerolatus]
MSNFTHFNEEGRAKMVDISDKQVTKRTATAQSLLEVPENIYLGITEGTVKKGDVLAVAQVAGIMAAKNTHQIIPMCHPLSLSGVDVSFRWDTGENYVLIIEATVKTTGKTGVEMEALTAASAVALTVYDMCKALDKGMIIKETKLLEKSGGKSGDYKA